MGQSNNNKKSEDKVKASYEDEIQDKENWLDEHGNPSYDFLQSLADNNNVEKLRSIASDLDAEYAPSDSAQELIKTIVSATGGGSNTTT